MYIYKIKLQFRTYQNKLSVLASNNFCVPKANVAICPELHKKKGVPKHAKSGLFSLKYSVFLKQGVTVNNRP